MKSLSLLFLLALLLFSFSFCDEQTKTPSTDSKTDSKKEETAEEFLQKEINSKIDFYLKVHNLENAKTIDKKTFVDLFKNATTSNKVSEFIEKESLLFAKIGEDMAQTFPEQIPVDNLKKIISVEEIINFFIKQTSKDDEKDDKNKNKKFIPGSSGDL